MRARGSHLSSLVSLLVLVLQSTMQVTTGSQFSSHITVNTPAKSFTHGVGDPIPTGTGGRRWSQPSKGSFKNLRRSQSTNQFGGYPRMRPSITFNNEDRAQRGSIHQVAPWLQSNFKEVAIPLLPPSPYKVDSPDPESLWPEGLFVPPHSPPRFGTFGRRADDGEVQAEPNSLDPYLLEGSEAVAAVERSHSHGHLYFHEIPHIDSLLANQELRANNQLKPHRIASLRHTWPYNRP